MLTEQQWVNRFAMALGNMGVRAEPKQLVELGRELYPIEGALEPEEVALVEFTTWPPQDT